MLLERTKYQHIILPYTKHYEPKLTWSTHSEWTYINCVRFNKPIGNTNSWSKCGMSPRWPNLNMFSSMCSLLLDLVADILLWRNKKLSGSILAGFTIIWFLFEVVELHFITVACYLLMILMLIRFVWVQAVDFFKWCVFLSLNYILDLILSS